MPTDRIPDLSGVRIQNGYARGRLDRGSNFTGIKVVSMIKIEKRMIEDFT